MSEENKNGDLDPGKAERLVFGGAISYLLLSIGIVSILLISLSPSEISYTKFEQLLKAGEIRNVTVGPEQITGTFTEKGSQKRFSTFKVDEPTARLLQEHGVTFSGTSSKNVWEMVFGWILGLMFFAALMTMLGTRFGGGNTVGQSFLSIERSKARVYKEESIKTSFADVAGVDEAKEELQEVVSFLKDPTKFTKLGARLPKGILLVGPPGTGKTLLARAVAGEAKVPFLSISGSEFVEMFVGVGAARVRDLFSEARAKSACIIFIDELDALGKARAGGPWAGTHDEKDQTLNQLLVELDGFDPSKGIVLLAATNRPELLDSALLRSGRFDRQVLVDRPDRKGRADILKVHIRQVMMDKDVDIDALAASTPGLTGADLANLVNEAALLASRRNASCVEEQDLRQAIERQIAGLERKGRIISQQEREIVAHHEMGHALVAMLLPGTDPVQKVSIIPRGTATLGFTMQRPEQDRFLLTETELRNRLAALLGGRAAELMMFGQASTGAADDLQKATGVARAMVTKFGMSDDVGLVCFENEGDGASAAFSFGNSFSQESARVIDSAIRGLINEAFSIATELLKNHKSALVYGAQQLLAKETLGKDELAALLSEPSKEKILL